MFGIGPITKYTMNLQDGWHLIEKQADDTYYIYDMPANEEEDIRFQPILVPQDKYDMYYKEYPVQTIGQTIQTIVLFLKNSCASPDFYDQDIINQYLEELNAIQKRTKKNENNPLLWGYYKKFLTIIDFYNRETQENQLTRYLKKN